MTVMVARKRRRTGDEKPQAPRVRAGQVACDVFLRASIGSDGVRWEQRCDGRLHGDDERHRPGVWVEVGPVEDVF